jgi:RES domain
LTLPAPPAALRVRPRIFELQTGALLVRFYDPARGPWDQQRSFGPLPEVRFDHHHPPLGEDPDRSIWYASTSLVGAVAEAFGSLGFVDKGAGRRVCVARARLPLHLLDLVGAGPRAFGLDQRLATSREYGRCQEWPRAFYDAYPDVRGLRWRGRQAGSLCCALNDRADMGSLDPLADHDLSNPAVWPRIARAARRCHLPVVAP